MATAAAAPIQQGKKRQVYEKLQLLDSFVTSNNTGPAVMIHLKSCWSPCFWHDNVRDGVIAVGVYSIGISICIITYTVYVLNGGDTSQLWLPFFETGMYIQNSLRRTNVE